MKFRLIFVFLFGLILSLPAKPPDWVQSRPIDRDYYIGIGSASIQKGSSDHIEQAKNEALRNLASEIVVNISGEIVTNMVEKSGLLEEELRSNIRSSTQAELEGYEQVDNWQDKNQYWVYYRLSRQKYRELHQAKVKKAVSLALNMFDQGRKSEAEAQIDKALLYYLQALNPLEKYIAETLQTEYEGRTIYLNNEIYFSIQNLLSSLSLEPSPAKLQVKRNQAVKQPLNVTAKFQGQTPVSNLPIAFTFTKGDGDLIKTARTNLNGIAATTISRMKSNDKMQFVSASLDIGSFISQDSTSYVYQNILKTFPLPSARIILDVIGLSFLIESEEANLGKNLQISQIAPKLKEALAAKGYSFTEDISSTDFLISIKASSREGSEMFGMFTAFVDLNVNVTDMSSGEDIYADVLSNVSGQGLSFEKAGLKAFEKAAEEFVTDFIRTMENKLK